MKTVLAAAVVAGALSAPGTAAAASEPRETDSGLPERWSTPTVTVVLDPSLEDLGPGTTDAVRLALGTWLADVPGLPAVVFEDGGGRRSAGRDGKNVVLAAPITTPGHEKDLALTTTYAADDTGAVLEADVVFNTRYAFAPMPSPGAACSGVFDVGAVATHESGHFFGLDEDWDDRATTMYVITDPCDAHKRELTPADTAAITALYEPPDVLVAKCDAAPPRRTGGPGAGPALVGLALALGARRMRRDDARRGDRPGARR